MTRRRRRHPLICRRSPGSVRVARWRGGPEGPVRLDHVRAVWAAVSRDPGASIADLAAATGLYRTAIRMALYALRDVYGYLDFPERAVGARRLTVPFFAVEPPAA